MRAREIFEFVDAIAPFSQQDDWDNAGFLVGDLDSEIERVLVALDATPELVDEAVRRGAQLIVTHHPVIFKAQKAFCTGDTAFAAAQQGVAFLCAHTNFDAAVGGVNDVLALLLGLHDVTEVFVQGEEQAMLRGGSVVLCRAGVLALRVRETLGAAVRLCLPEKQVQRIAVCGGSGAQFLEAVAAQGFDALVTGDADHHDFLDAARLGVSLLAAGHFETEQPAMAALARVLKERFAHIEVLLSEQRTPVAYI